MVAKQEPMEPPSWFDEIDFDELANALNPLLQEKLAERLGDELGQQLAGRMEIWQIDSYRENVDPPGGELEEIAQELNEALHSILVEWYSVPPEEAQEAMVRRWGMVAATRNPSCESRKCWDPVLQSWCSWKTCCPCG